MYTTNSGTKDIRILCQKEEGAEMELNPKGVLPVSSPHYIHPSNTSIAVPLCDYYDYGYWSFDTVYHFVDPLPNTRAWVQLSVQLIHPCSILYPVQPEGE